MDFPKIVLHNEILLTITNIILQELAKSVQLFTRDAMIKGNRVPFLYEEIIIIFYVFIQNIYIYFFINIYIKFDILYYLNYSFPLSVFIKHHFSFIKIKNIKINIYYYYTL